MKKILVSACIGALIIAGTANAASFMDSINDVAKSVTADVSSSKSKTAAAEAAKQKEFQTIIDAQKKKLVAVNSISRTAKWDLAKALLSDADENETSIYQTLKNKQNDINKNKELASADKAKELEKIDTEVVNELLKVVNQKPKKIKTKDSEGKTTVTITGGFLDVYENLSNTQKTTYVNAVTNLQNANNKYENIANALSPSFKKILDGEFSMTKSQLKETSSMVLDVKNNKSSQGKLLSKLKHANEKLNIAIDPSKVEKVVYSKDGIIGSINYQMDGANSDVKNAYKDLMDVLDCQKSINTEIAKFKSDNPDATREELKVAYKKIAKDEMRKAAEIYVKADSDGKVTQLNAEKKVKFVNATNTLINAGVKYVSLSAQCAALGLKIYGNPILAAPLALEIDQLKYTGIFLKESAVNIKNVTPPLIKMANAQNIGDQIKMPSADAFKLSTKK